MTITNQQLRAGRALLQWTQERLAQAVGVSALSVIRAEDGSMSPVRNRIVAALEAAGIEFLQEEDGRIGVRLDPTCRNK